MNPSPRMLRKLQVAMVKHGSIYAELDAPGPSKTLQKSTDKKGKGWDIPSSTMTTPAAKLSLPNYVDAKERNARRNEGLCIKCRAPDHMMQQCENRYSITHLSTNKDTALVKEKEEANTETGKVGQEEVLESEELGKE